MYRLCIATALLACMCLLCVPAVDWDVETPLDAYVNRPDPAYSYYLLDVYDDDPDFVVHVYNMTSQIWMDESWSDSPLWWHYLSIFIPRDHGGAVKDAGFLHIGNGNHNDSTPTMENSWMQRTGNFCRNTKAVAGYLRTVPYQPIKFPGYPLPKTEDWIIGYTWRMYIEAEGEPNPDWVVLLPMAKAAKMALDTMTEVANNYHESFSLQRFMPTGFSKRGWTTWLLGCVDQRVFAMAPTVFDLLNMVPNLEHHNRGLGGWSWAFYPYWYENVSQYLYHPRTQEMANFIDPISYNERLTMPKLIISAAGDEFFPPDDANFFIDEINGPTYLQIWENDDHSVGNHLDERDHNIQAFFLHNLNADPLPVITWTRSETGPTGKILVSISETPLTITSWWADSTNITCEPYGDTEGTCRRDFRIRTLRAESGVWWQQEPVYDLGNNEYVVAYDVPPFGFRGFFIEMTFPSTAEGYTFRFTTSMQIIPDIYPYPKCETEAECAGRLV